MELLGILEGELGQVMVDHHLDREVHLLVAVAVVVVVDSVVVLRQEEADRFPAATEDMGPVAVRLAETDRSQIRQLPPEETPTPAHRPVVLYSGASR